MTDDDKARLLSPYERTWTLTNEFGYITWRHGTGMNIELLHLKVTETRHGHGRRFLQAMLDSMIGAPVGLMVFGFCLASNVAANQFYFAMGFDLVKIPGLYRDGDGVMFHQKYTKLMEQTSNES